MMRAPRPGHGPRPLAGQDPTRSISRGPAIAGGSPAAPIPPRQGAQTGAPALRFSRPRLRGWGQYFRTGNAADKFNEIDKYVTWRLKRMRIKRKGRHLKPGERRRWNKSYFYALGLHKLSGTVAYPEAA